MARPPKPESEKLTERVAFRLTKADFEAYSKKVAESGLNESEFFRNCVLTNKTEIIAKKRNDKRVDRMLFLMNKTSNNINQWAHRLNSDHLAGKASEETHLAALGELRLISQYLKAALYVD